MITGLVLFPGGVVGAGLLLMRCSVALSLIVLTNLGGDSANWLQFLRILAAISLCAGIQTRVIAGLGLLAVLPVFGFSPVWLLVLHGVNSVAVLLAGAGAWSADAALFGRRQVSLPERDDTKV